MSDGGSSKSWFTTLPGILTALAGIITAVTGLLLALDKIGWIGANDDSTAVAEQPAAPPPASKTASVASARPPAARPEPPATDTARKEPEARIVPPPNEKPSAAARPETPPVATTSPYYVRGSYYVVAVQTTRSDAAVGRARSFADRFKLDAAVYELADRSYVVTLGHRARDAANDLLDAVKNRKLVGRAGRLDSGQDFRRKIWPR